MAISIAWVWITFNERFGRNWHWSWVRLTFVKAQLDYHFRLRGAIHDLVGNANCAPGISTRAKVWMEWCTRPDISDDIRGARIDWHGRDIRIPRVIGQERNETI
jgi:hypothetical protein